MLLQVLGLVPIFKSILDLRHEFEYPGVFASIKAAWRNRPRFYPPPNNMVISGGIGSVRAGISACQSVESGPSDSLEYQIDAIRKTVKMLRDNFEQNKRMTANTIERHRQELNMETREQSVQLSGFARKMRSVHTSGLAWSASGAVWIGAGIVLSSMSIELHRWL
ncbi:hypothetical protein [Acidiphilium acidophilum]|uniref:hypothetical protein n=1 Tax=Acidiphilium acidophilum TaxID=76588 RepID=UPI002E8E754D|nr:hypothetical protein [Acidiphilium acidophilum]